jgi:hypothetical protein
MTYYVLSELLKAIDYSQLFFPRGTVHAFGRRQSPARVANNSELVALTLLQHGP